jgi:deoxyribonuclease V
VALDWAAAAAVSERTSVIAIPDDYEAGAFFRRELPALLAVLTDVSSSLTTVLVDGYAWLGPERPGLGAHLWRALDKRVPVVGVAKTAFLGAQATPVLRGGSARPLYLTAAGMDAAEAAVRIAAMHGGHRIPTLIRRADHLARGLP